MNHNRITLSALCLSLVSFAAAQDAPSPPPSPLRTRSHVETSVSLGTGAQLTASRVTSFYQNVGAQSFDSSATVLGSIRQSVHPWLGYSANFGYTRTTEQNRGIAVFYNVGPFAIPTNAYEISLSYLIQKHLTRNRTGFADLGGGILGFLPVHRGDTAANFVPNRYPALVPAYQSRPLGIAGVGIDLRLNQRLALRAEYRGLLYKFPDGGNGSVGKALTESSQPTVSLVYRFRTGPVPSRTRTK